MRRFARGLASDPALADDLVQDCLERALTRLHLFDENRSMRTWLFTILRNTYVNEMRREGRRGSHINFDLAGNGNLAEEAPQMSRLAVRDIAQALQQLPDEQREVLLLISLEDMSYQEAAEVIGSPVGTVMSRLSRARNRLKQLMDAGE